jgi:hypothetical protein
MAGEVIIVVRGDSGSVGFQVWDAIPLCFMYYDSLSLMMLGFYGNGLANNDGNVFISYNVHVFPFKSYLLDL